MPIATITTLPGASDEQKRMVIANVTEALVQSLDVKPAAVRVLITEVPASAWGVGGTPIGQI